MKDRDQKLIWEARWGHGRPRAGAKRQTSAELDKDSPSEGDKWDKHWAEVDKDYPGEGIRVKASSSWRDAHENEEDVVDSSKEETYEERGQRREGKGLLKALLPWIETARGEQLNEVYQSILAAYQAAGYPETGGDERVERDDDYRGEDPSPRETDQDRYGYSGDR